MEELQHLHYASMIFFMLFCGIGVFDGYYFHLQKYELHKHPSSRTENLIHAYRAFLFVPITYLLFVENVYGFLLWTVVFLIVLDMLLELWDVLEEKQAREPLGGISSVETAVHIFATAAKSISFTLILVAKPIDAWNFDFLTFQTEMSYPNFLVIPGMIFCLTFLIGGIIHLYLLLPVSRKTEDLFGNVLLKKKTSVL